MPADGDDEVLRIEEPVPVEESTHKEQEHAFNDDEEDSWYLGKARDEFRRRRGMQVPDREEDPVQVSRFLVVHDLFPLQRCSGPGIVEMRIKTVSTHRKTTTMVCVLGARKSSLRRRC